ncbi:MAG: hypothetical protein KTR14_08085 [Vampirovibrio sp.]|nr:hypothetical protein [Vampirovibrio sp.]
MAATLQIKKLIESLLQFEYPVEQWKEVYKEIPPNHICPTVATVTRAHVINILERYIKKELNEDDISVWAGVVFTMMGRPVILEPGYTNALANELEYLNHADDGDFSPELAQRTIGILKNLNYDPNSME